MYEYKIAWRIVTHVAIKMLQFVSPSDWGLFVEKIYFLSKKKFHVQTTATTSASDFMQETTLVRPGLGEQ